MGRSISSRRLLKRNTKRKIKIPEMNVTGFLAEVEKIDPADINPGTKRIDNICVGRHLKMANKEFLVGR